MSKLFGNFGWAAMTIMFTALSLSAVPAAAEKREMTYVRKNLQTASKSSVPIAGGRELVQEVVLSDMQYSHPDFKIKNDWVHLQSDLTNGSGPHHGHYIDFHEDGSQTFGEFQGTTKLVTKSDGSWESSWEGTYKYLGGTGRFKNIKGSGKYKGSISSANPAGEESGQESVEY